MPDRVVLNSSVITAVRYDASENFLDVEFNSGRVYRYWMVSSAVYEGLIQASSAGQYFNTEIRNRFPHRELTP
jgi:hypothetical protein